MSEFLDCVKKGGKIKTKSFSKGRYQRFCTIEGKEYAGEVETKNKK